MWEAWRLAKIILRLPNFKQYSFFKPPASRSAASPGHLLKRDCFGIDQNFSSIQSSERPAAWKSSLLTTGASFHLFCLGTEFRLPIRSTWAVVYSQDLEHFPPFAHLFKLLSSCFERLESLSSSHTLADTKLIENLFYSKFNFVDSSWWNRRFICQIISGVFRVKTLERSQNLKNQEALLSSSFFDEISGPKSTRREIR